MPTLATRFSLLLAGLRDAIAPVAARDRARTGLLVLVWAHLARTATRFERLFARWRNGSLPRRGSTKPGTTHPRPATATAPAPRAAAPRLPRAHAWLLHQLREAAPSASQLQHFVATPELAAFLAEVPQAGRLLRPLCRMLGVSLPVVPARPEPTPGQPPARPAPTPSATEPRPPGPASTILPELFSHA